MDTKAHCRFRHAEFSHSTQSSDLSIQESLSISPVIVTASCREENVGNVREIIKEMRSLSLPNLHLAEPAADAVEEPVEIDINQTTICYELDSDNTWTIARGSYPTESCLYPQETETVAMITKQKTKKRSWFSKSKRNKADDGFAGKFGRGRSKSSREFSKSTHRGSNSSSRRRVSTESEPKSSFNKFPGLLKKKGTKHDKNVPVTSSLSSLPEPETIKALVSWVEEAANLSTPQTTASLAANIPRRNTVPARGSPHPLKKNHATTARKISAPVGIKYNQVIDLSRLSRERKRSIESLISPNFRRRSFPSKHHSEPDKEKIERLRQLYGLISPTFGKKDLFSGGKAQVMESSSEESVFERIREDLRSRKTSNPWIFNAKILRNNRGSIKKSAPNENPLLLSPSEVKSSVENLSEWRVSATPQSDPPVIVGLAQEVDLTPVTLTIPINDTCMTASSSSSEALDKYNKPGSSPRAKSPEEKSDSSPSNEHLQGGFPGRKQDSTDEATSPDILGTSPTTIFSENTEESSKTSTSLRDYMPTQEQLSLLPRSSLSSASKLSTSDSGLSQYCTDTPSSGEEQCQATQQRFTKPQDFLIYRVIKEELQSKLEHKEFSRPESHQLCSEVSNAIKCRVQEMKLEDYKITCAVFIGAIRGTGIHVASRSTWDSNHDNFTSATFSNSSLFASATVLATKYQ